MKPGEKDDLHNTGRAFKGVGLLFIDLINPMNFEGAQDLLPKFDDVVNVAVRLRNAADELGVPTIYVNDNYGQWHSDRSKIVEACLDPKIPSCHLLERVTPRACDYFVIKPQVSGFYATNLPALLPRLGISRLAMVGVAADICILFTAADAHMRQYDLWVPADGVASENDARRDWALDIMAKTMDAETQPTGNLSLQVWLTRGGHTSLAEIT